MVYYNEFDTKKAAWLRELIKAGAIAKGEVDERSIELVRPDDLHGFAQCHFFAGIGIWSYALRLAGWPDDKRVWTASCPCQPFSAAGKKKGTADRRHLWPVLFPLIRERRPVVCFGEQVASPDGLAWLDDVRTDLEGEAYTFGAVDICAAGAGAPHIRNRIVFVADLQSERWRTGMRHNDARQPDTSGSGADGILADTLSQRIRTEGRSEVARAARETRSRFDQRERLRVDSGECEPSGVVADATDPRRDDAREYGSGSSLQRARSEQRGCAGVMADSMRSERRQSVQQQEGHEQASRRNESADRIGECGPTEFVGSSDEAGSQGLNVGRNSGSECATRETGVVDGMADAENAERGRSGTSADGRRGTSEVRGPSDSRGMADSDGGESRDGRIQRSGQHGFIAQDAEPAGPVNGFWRESGWVLCRPERDGDSPSWRPVERGTFPLVNGSSCRVGRLRGYGDGIVAPLITEFIKACIAERGYLI